MKKLYLTLIIGLLLVGLVGAGLTISTSLNIDDKTKEQLVNKNITKIEIGKVWCETLLCYTTFNNKEFKTPKYYTDEKEKRFEKSNEMILSNLNSKISQELNLIVNIQVKETYKGTTTVISEKVTYDLTKTGKVEGIKG